MERVAQGKRQPIFICKKIYHRREPSQPAFTISNQLNKLASPFHVMSSEVGQPVLGLHIFRNLAEEKVNMAPKNTSKSGPIFCVNSMLTQNDSVLLQFFIP